MLAELLFPFIEDAEHEIVQAMEKNGIAPTLENFKLVLEHASDIQGAVNDSLSETLENIVQDALGKMPADNVARI